MLSVFLKLILLSLLLYVSSITLLNMWKGNAGYNTLSLLLLSSSAQLVTAQCNADAPEVDLTWHAPNSTVINNLTAVVNGSGIYGFQFTAQTQNNVPYSRYNWCNMPHVRPQEYIKASSDYELVYVEVIQRHHKRTPYADNTFPHETYEWTCDDEALLYYGIPIPDSQAAQIAWSLYTTPTNPLAPAGFNGTCQFPQITGQGLNDSRQHGLDLFSVYGSTLNFLPSTLDPKKVVYRVTNNVITSQVAGQLILGMYPSSSGKVTPVLIQPDSIDSLEPNYECDASDSLRESYSVGSDVANWTLHLNQSERLFSRLDAVSGVNETDPDWHNWFDHYFDNLSARLCHQKPLPCSADDDSLCITEEEADAVFRRGQYEYSFIYRDAPESLAMSTSAFGVWMAELAQNLRDVMNGEAEVLYRHNVAHDGSMSRLLSILQVDVMVWPGMGSEVVFELYKGKGCYYLRVLWGGQVLRSTNPSLGLLNMVSVERLLGYVDGLVGKGARKVPGLCEEESD
jgi:2-phosphoxylose phosphatase